MIGSCPEGMESPQGIRRGNGVVKQGDQPVASSLLVLGIGLALVVWAAAHGKKDWPVPEEARKVANPVPATSDSIAAGKALYSDNCEQCHGERGKGDGPEAEMYKTKPADFSDAHMMSEMTDGEVFYKITEGRRPMPSFKKKLTDTQRWQLVNYLRTFAPQATKSAAPAGKSGHKH